MKRNLMYILLATTFWLMPFVSHAESKLILIFNKSDKT